MPNLSVIRRSLLPHLFVGLLVTLSAVDRGFAADAETTAKIKHAQAMGIKFLATTQAEDGSWTVPNNAGITGLVTASLLRSGIKREESVVAKGLKHLESFVQPDGGIYDKESSHRNYETSIALLAFAAANTDGKYDALIGKARDFLKGLQWDESEKISKESVEYGGAGYGRSKRPDLSNTAFLLDALKAAGVKEDDEAMKNAVVFVSRCQNLETEHNTTAFAAKINDGGFYYTPAGGGSSMAGLTENGGLRSYGSMTYAGLKSFLYAGVKKDDPRVVAAVTWLKKNYTLKENPGMGEAGLYYYLHTVAKALDALGSEEVQDAKGIEHPWRAEMTNVLLPLQKENGSWVNATPRWMEGDPNMTTAYVLLTLKYLESK